MLWTFPLVWLVLALPFGSAAVIARAQPLRGLAARHHRITWTIGVSGLCAFLAGFVGLLPTAWAAQAVLVGGAISGFACFWPTRPDDGGDDWRRWVPAPDGDRPPPGLPNIMIDWQQFDHLRAQWERQGHVAP
jgi:hypothetical protein